MGKKTKSKARLDKYYYLAKQEGFRSRAAFKLIQLNKKFHFLESANVLIDLCAAPGGWCQVAAREMPISSIKIGVDLVPIKAIPGVITFQSDITTEQCRHLIRKEIKHFKADVVLHDGAPNVGGQWSKDSYSQTELVLYAIKLATDFLKEGGWFISKVFRSSDYNSLIYVMRQLFGKVEATKPLASRSQAAEIFVVCSQYKAPSSIDPKLLDPKYALKQLEDEDEMKSNTFKSIKAMFDKKKSRSGYSNDSLYLERSFKDFIECNNPYQFLYETNKIKVKTEDCEKYINIMKAPVDYQIYFDDLQVLGRKEVADLIIWRNKIKNKIKPKKFNEEEKKEDKDNVKENDVNEEIDAEIKKLERQKKKKMENEKKKKEKNELKIKKDFIEQEEQIEDNDVEFDEGLFDYIRKNKIDIEAIDGEQKDDKKEEEKDNEGEYSEIDLSELDEDDIIEMMNKDIEEHKRQYEEEKGKNPKKKNKKKKKEEIELVQQEKDKESDLDSLNDDNKDNSESEEEKGDNSSDYDEDEIELDEKNSKGEDEDENKDDVIISNPLRKKKDEDKKNLKLQKEDKNEEENLSSDTDDEEEQSKKFLNKKTKREKKKDKDNTKIKVDKEKEEDNSDNEGKSSSDDDGYDTDEKAEIRAIAKKMLRKKERIKILNSTYNRYAFNEDDRAPQWFIDEEKQHNVPQKPVTKAEILAERAYLKKINDRMPKKVLEAKARKRNKLNKRLEKVKRKAEAIYNQDEINELSKVKQIEKLYKKEFARSKEKKKYIISRSFNNNKGKDGRNIRHVDRRMKKDKRAIKAKEKRDKKYKRRKR